MALAMIMRSPNSWVIRLGIRSLAAACAGAGELQQGLLELAALDSGSVNKAGLLFGDMLSQHSRSTPADPSGWPRGFITRALSRLAGQTLAQQAAARAVQRVDMLHQR